MTQSICYLQLRGRSSSGQAQGRCGRPARGQLRKRGVRNLFERLSSVTREVVEQIESGASALQLAESMGLADRREALNTAAERMRRSRHELQRSMFLLALAEGASRAEIARVWRVYRQLVSRMVENKVTVSL